MCNNILSIYASMICISDQIETASYHIVYIVYMISIYTPVADHLSYSTASHHTKPRLHQNRMTVSLTLPITIYICVTCHHHLYPFHHYYIILYNNIPFTTSLHISYFASLRQGACLISCLTASSKSCRKACSSMSASVRCAIAVCWLTCSSASCASRSQRWLT